MKLVKRIAAIVLCLAMFCSLSACSLEDPDNKNAVGTWRSDDVDFGSILNEAIGADDAEMAQYYDFSDAKINFTYELKEDKTYKFYVDDESIAKFNDVARAAISKGAEAQFGALAAELNMTADEVLDASGFGGVDEFTESIMADINGEALVGDFKMEGNWLISDGKFISTTSTEKNIAEDGTYVLYKLEGDTLTIDMPADYAGDDAFMYPLNFTRQ